MLGSCLFRKVTVIYRVTAIYIQGHIYRFDCILKKTNTCKTNKVK